MAPHRKSLRIKKAFDEYQIKFGSAGFAVILKNGKRIQPHDTAVTLRKRREQQWKSPKAYSTQQIIGGRNSKRRKRLRKWRGKI